MTEELYFEPAPVVLCAAVTVFAGVLFLIAVISGGADWWFIGGSAVITVGGALITVGTPFEATLSQDGTLVFRSVARSYTTNVSEIRTIEYCTSEGAGGYDFVYDGGHAVVQSKPGRKLVERVLDLNPNIETKGF